MRIYLAGNPASPEERERIKLVRNRLLSFWEIQADLFKTREAFELIKNENLFSDMDRG